MLIISRKKDEKIIIGDEKDEIEITILKVERNRIKFGIIAPKHIKVHTDLKSPQAEPPQAQPRASRAKA